MLIFVLRKSSMQAINKWDYFNKIKKNDIKSAFCFLAQALFKS